MRLLQFIYNVRNNVDGHFHGSRIIEHAGMKSWHATESSDVFVVKPQQLQSDATTNSEKLREPNLLEPNREFYLPQILLKVGILLFELWIKFRLRVNFILSRKSCYFKEMRNSFFLLQWIIFSIYLEETVMPIFAPFLWTRNLNAFDAELKSLSNYYIPSVKSRVYSRNNQHKRKSTSTNVFNLIKVLQSAHCYSEFSSLFWIWIDTLNIASFGMLL